MDHKKAIPSMIDPWWPLEALAAIQLAAASGLMIGIWIRPLALLTAVTMEAYFLIAIGMHICNRDFGRNLFVNANRMLALCVAKVVFVAQAV